MKEFMQRRNLTKVTNVKNALLIKTVLEVIKEFKHVKQLTDAVYVTSMLHRNRILGFIKEFIQQRKL